jgi:preprotein translocase subunit YajC
MFDVAYAQTGPGAGGMGSLISFAPLILVFAIFYMLLIRPQQKKAK